MRKEATGQQGPADLIDNTDPVGKKATRADQKQNTGEGKNKTANQPAMTGRTPPRGLRQKWLREIAKTAASAPWKRGD